MQKNIKKFFFQNHIFGCRVGDNLILLDTKKDNYVFLSYNDLEPILPFLSTTLFIEKYSNELSDLYADNHPTISELLHAKILTEDFRHGKILSAPDVLPPDTFFEQLETESWPEISWHHPLMIFTIGVYTALRLRLISLSRILKKISNTSNKFPTQEESNKSLHLARIYHQLRPILPKSRVCLYDTLTFYYFCRFYGSSPTIVFGIAGDPFDAHCWAQSGNVILNDVPQNILNFSPIFSS